MRKLRSANNFFGKSWGREGKEAQVGDWILVVQVFVRSRHETEARAKKEIYNFRSFPGKRY